MKNNFFIKTKLLACIIFIITISFVIAQPCKSVKPGMTVSEVLKLVGQPGNRLYGDSLFKWNYGNQQVIFSRRSEKVIRIIADMLKENSLNIDLAQGIITLQEYDVRLEKINKEACK